MLESPETKQIQNLPLPDQQAEVASESQTRTVGDALGPVVYFLLGFLLLQLVPFFFLNKTETPISQPIEFAGYKTIAWKIRDSLTPGQTIRVSAQHRLSGTEGRFRFAVYESLNENYEPPHLVMVSEPFEARENGQWSSWTFTAAHPVVFVGMTWEQDHVPVVLQNEAWKNPLNFTDSAYTGPTLQLNAKALPIKSHLRWQNLSDTAAKSSSSDIDSLVDHRTNWFWWLLIPLAGLAITLRVYRIEFSTKNIILFTLGLVMAYRAWAWFVTPFWAWGSFFIAYVPLEIRLVLFLASPLLAVAILNKPARSYMIGKRSTQVCVLIALLGLAWLFRCQRVYGDWVFGYTNHTHAPLTASLYFTFQNLTSKFSWIQENFNQLISVVVFMPFLLVLMRFVSGYDNRSFALTGESITKIPLAPFVMLLSATSLQCFFGYIEVYSVPMFFWLAFAFSSFRYLEGRWPLWAPTLVSFVAYLAHVSEAMLIFSVVFLWIYDLVKHRPSALRLAGRIAVLGTIAITLTGVSYSLLYVFKFHSDLAAYTKEFSHYGFEILMGQHRHAGVSLPLFSVTSLSGPYTPPGPDYATFSFENILKVLGFQFHYSLFFFVVPALILIRDRFRPLRDPKVAFVTVSLIAYTIYAGFAYVGWVPVIRDWDLFAAYSLIGGTLTFLLLKKENDENGMWAIAAVNLIQTIPWILINHFPVSLPW